VERTGAAQQCVTLPKGTMDDVTERAVSRPRMQQLAWNNTSTSLRAYEHLEHVLLSPDGTTVETAIQAIDSKHRSATGQDRHKRA
jgi:hypothetical protein